MLLEQERQEMVKMVGPQGMISTIAGMLTLFFWTMKLYFQISHKNVASVGSLQVWILMHRCLLVSVCCHLRSRESRLLLVKMPER